MSSDYEGLRVAAEYLASQPDCTALIREIRRMAQVIGTRDERVFGGEQACLNALVDAAVTNPAGIEAIIQQVEAYRASLPKEHRREYQRTLMRDRRERQRIAARIHELKYGVSLSGNSRATFIATKHEQWMKARNAFLAGHPNASWDERHELTAQFWAALDQRQQARLRELEGRGVQSGRGRQRAA
jgi:hypothetical protein